jgi:flagellar motor switch/type III secretory pathway protein FliN
MQHAEPAKREAGLEIVALRNEREEAEQLLMRAHMLPCRLLLEAAVINFTVDTLMSLQPGAIVETAAQHNEDLLISVNGQLLGAAKFDVTRDKLAVRLTGVA